MANFEIKAKDGLARLGRFTTKHGTVRTPLLMPVIHPGKSVIPPKDLVDVFGFQMVITNSYIIKITKMLSRYGLVANNFIPLNIPGFNFLLSFSELFLRMCPLENLFIKNGINKIEHDAKTIRNGIPKYSVFVTKVVPNNPPS